MKINAIIIGLLVIAGLTNCQTGVPVTGPSGTVCESPGGSCVGLKTGTLISYANNCTKYIVCQGGCGCDMECPENLHFNSELQVCDWPDNAGCDPSYAPSPGTGGSPTPNPGPGGSPTPNPGPGGSPTPNPGPGGSPTPNPGPGGSPTPNPGPGGSPTPNPGPGGSPTPNPGPGGNGTVPSNPGCESPGGSCKGIETDTLINYENNCNKFIACQGGCGIAMNCPANLHFNYELQMCDWPDQAGCDPSYAPNPGPGGSPTPNPGPGGSPTPNPGPGGSPTPNPGPGGSPTPNPGPGGNGTETPEPICESAGGSCKGMKTGTLINYANNCSRFIACQGGCGIDMDCPANLHFNSELQVCDWPDNAGCDPSYSENPGTGGNGTVPSNPGCESPGGSCKGIETDTLINYENNCNKFIACQGGCGIAMNCPANLHFNYELQMCDWPDQAGCDPSYAPNPGPGGSPTPNPGPGGSPTPNPGPGGSPTPTPGPGGSPTPTPGPGGSPTPTPGPGGSPTPNPGPGGSPTPNPGPGGSPTPNPGPGGSPTPNPGPGGSPTPNPGPGESPTPNPGPGGPATGPSGTVCESPGGSCVGLKTGTLISYANNCTKYIVCQGGCGCDMECPDNLHFNSELQVCDWPDQAGCDPSYAASAE